MSSLTPEQIAQVISTRLAPEGHIWVCGACGKVARGDRYGDAKSDRGWDVSCVMNSFLVDEKDITLTLNANGVPKVTAVAAIAYDPKSEEWRI